MTTAGSLRVRSTASALKQIDFVAALTILHFPDTSSPPRAADDAVPALNGTRIPPGSRLRNHRRRIRMSEKRPCGEPSLGIDLHPRRRNLG